MKLQSVHNNFINPNSYSDKKPVFREWKRDVYRNAQDVFVRELKHRNDTMFFRDGNYWSSLVDFLISKYNQTERVNVYNYGCSDGSEPYTFVMSILSKLDAQAAKKFFPILARDYDSMAISKAKEGVYYLNEHERSRTKKLNNFKLGDYFDIERQSARNIYLLVSPKETLTSKVDFKVASILKDYKNIKPDNSIVFARNFWPYLKDNVVKLVHKLSSQMKENSTLILGNFDIDGCQWNNINIETLLIKNGFKAVSGIDLVFEK